MARGTCDLPPEGWYCSQAKGHKGPCPTYRDDAISRRVAEIREDHWSEGGFHSRLPEPLMRECETCVVLNLLERYI